MSQENMNYKYDYSYYSNHGELKPVTTMTTIRTNNSLFKDLEQEECKRCQKYIYPLELLGPVMGHRYHKQCFRCNICDRLLDFKSYRTNLDDLNDKQIYCVNHNPRTGHHSNFIFIRPRSKSPNYNHDLNSNYYRHRNKSTDNIDSQNYSSYTLNPSINRSDDRLNQHSSFNHNINRIPINVKIESNSVSDSFNKNVKIEENANSKFTEFSHREEKSSATSTLKNEVFSESKEYKTHSHSQSESYSYVGNNGPSTYNVIPPTSNNHRPPSIDRLNSYNRSSSLDNYGSHSSDNRPHYLSNIISEIIQHDKSIPNNYYDYYRNNSRESTGSHSNLRNIITEVNKSNERLYETNSEIKNQLKYIVDDMVSKNKTPGNHSYNNIANNNNNNYNSYNNYKDSNNNIYNYEQDFRRNSNESQTTSHKHSSSISSEVSSKENYNYRNEKIININEPVKPNLHDVILNTYDKSKLSNDIKSSSNSNLHGTNNTGASTIHSSYSHSSAHTSSSQTTFTEHRIIPGSGSSNNLVINNTPLLPPRSPNMPHHSYLPNHNNNSNNFINPSTNYKPNDPYEYTHLNPNSKSPYLSSIMADILGRNNNSSTNFVNPNSGYKPTHNRPIEINANEVHKIIGDDRGLGIVRLTVQYDDLRTRLSITIHEARYLRNLEKNSSSDPYVRIYLSPDEKPTLKRKTKVIKNNLNPIWQETFDYRMTYNDAIKKELTVNLKDERGLFEKQDGKFLGEIVFKLKSIDLRQPVTRWFHLQPLNSPLNYKF